MLRRLRAEPDPLEGCTAALMVDAGSELYTKSTAAELALAVNLAGCALIGRPLVEATGSLSNFRIQASNMRTDLNGAYRLAAKDLVDRLLGFQLPRQEQPELLVLHASSHHTSNTMQLWEQVKERLDGRCAINEIGLRNGTLSDCSGYIQFPVFFQWDIYGIILSISFNISLAVSCNQHAADRAIAVDLKCYKLIFIL